MPSRRLAPVHHPGVHRGVRYPGAVLRRPRGDHVRDYVRQLGRGGGLTLTLNLSLNLKLQLQLDLGLILDLELMLELKRVLARAGERARCGFRGRKCVLIKYVLSRYCSY